VNWKGCDDEAQAKYPAGFRKREPYLRLVNQPK
jgi:hypothetical protein